MKKIIVAVFAIFMATTSFAHIIADWTVYEWGTGTNKGTIVKFDNGYFLLGNSDNQFEHEFHSVCLGKTKSEAVWSIELLDSLNRTLAKDECVTVVGFPGKTTLVFKYLGAVYIHTKGVAGNSSCLLSLKLDKAIEAINKYQVLNKSADDTEGD
jgi:hypothetical protein